MIEDQELLNIERKELLGAVAELQAAGYRLAQICSTTLAGGYEMSYSFDRDYRFKSLRIMLKPGEEVQSISPIYWNAFLYENEIHDLFGIPIKNIVIDYGGTLYRTLIPFPFGLKEKPEGQKEVFAKSAEVTKVSE